MAQLGPLSSPALHPALPSASTPTLLGMEHPIPSHPTPPQGSSGSDVPSRDRGTWAAGASHCSAQG